MSTFKVTIEQIGSIREHSNADRLEIATLAGKDYDFVVIKGQFAAGDPVVYFPVDSVLPQWITDAIGLTGKLSGASKNRVKTIKLRGQISQGIVTEPHVLSGGCSAILQAQIGDDVTEMLGIEKYEPPVIFTRTGKLLPLPPGVSKYDIENAQNYQDIVDYLMDVPAYITEKLEGSHWGITLMTDASTVIVTQRNFAIKPVDDREHDWLRIAREGDFASKLYAIAEGEHYPSLITLRGEVIGPRVQGNHYGLDRLEVRLFELEINGIPVSPRKFLHIADVFNLATVPVLGLNITLRQWLNGRTLKEASDGLSVLADVAREGIVIKPMYEYYHETLGHFVLKQRGPEYLASSEY